MHYIPIKENKCPFGIRDLSPVDATKPYGKKHDECYLGSGVHRCEYFHRYVWEGEHSGCIECSCSLPDATKPVQLELF